MTATGATLLDLARPHIGERYVLGSFVPKDDPKWVGPWDCAEFVVWVIFQVTGRLVGCSSNFAKPSKADAWTGFLKRDGQAGVLDQVPWEEALSIPGAMLLRYPAEGAVGHVAFSDGKGGTIEALNGRAGVVAGGAKGRRWDVGLLVDGVSYPKLATVTPDPLPVILRVGSTGPAVRRLQELLAKRGLPLVADGAFGQATLRAVIRAQQQLRLVVDGEVGPSTLAALEAP